MNNKRHPLVVARELAKVYGQSITLPLFYSEGIAIAARLSDSLIGIGVDDPIKDIERLVAPYIEAPTASLVDGFGTASYTFYYFLEALFQQTGNRAYEDALLEVANLFNPASNSTKLSPPLDPDHRVEDTFFAAAILGRAFKLSNDADYLQALLTFLLGIETQQANGLYFHSRSSPFFWGRGNAFAAMGFAEALRFVPNDHPLRKPLLTKHINHLHALLNYQSQLGMWHQVIDMENSYPEFSATCMIGFSMALGLNNGWLSSDWLPAITKAFSAVEERISPVGELKDVCTHTSPMKSIDEYLTRPKINGTDSRGGAMALLFLLEYASLVER